MVAFKFGRMNQRYLMTAVALFSAVVGTPSVGRSQMTNPVVPTSPSLPSNDAMKVGEYQTQSSSPINTGATEIHTHNLAGRQAATLYIRNIPVLTFVGQQLEASSETKVGAVASENSPTNVGASGVSTDLSNQGISNQSNQSSDDPVQRASVVAARVNDLIRQRIDASKITVSWRGGETPPLVTGNKGLASPQESIARYVIQVNGQELVAIDDSTRLPDSTKNRASDALQATNRLRRLIGNASPINEIADLPINLPSISMPKLPKIKLPDGISVEPIKVAMRGVASFYGYDGSGNRTATGERFNPEGMTAAHRHLPFGTRVRVTNTHNGRSVVVRINDRGPFIRGRVLDLSYGAARILGMLGNGVAPVKIEVLGR
jgi:rare lipoprotein A